MAEATKQGQDQGIGEGNLRDERGAPPYADRAYAGEREPGGETGTSLEGTAGGTNVSSQGGSADSSKAGGNAGGSGAQGHGGR
ncbi:MAG TPA: hypothetical protein VN282_12595 [Pyrinomonadaceae bacterium]|nr:hypothetical protein [Pyrinomonadaceae bacterium]